MQVDKKEIKSTRVAKSVLHKKQGVLDDLMGQIDDDDDDKNSSYDAGYKKKNNNNLKNENINYDDFDEDYVPGYSKQKKETTVDNINEDINMESNNEISTNLLQKRPIKREVKVVENDNNNLNTNSINRSGIKRIVK